MQVGESVFLKKQYKKDIIVLAGTSVAKEVIEVLVKKGYKIAAMVLKKNIDEFTIEHKNVTIIEPRITLEGLIRFINKSGANFLLDISHPFGIDISNSAMEACLKTKIKYINYQTKIPIYINDNITRVKDYSNAAQKVKYGYGKVLADVETRELKVFTKTINNYKERLIVKVFPDNRAMSKCEELEIPHRNIIAYRGGLSENLYFELFKFYDINCLIAQETGYIGGTREKIKAALKFGIPIIIIKKPEIDYTHKAHNIKELLELIKKLG